MCERIYKQKFITLKELLQLSHHMDGSKSLNCSAAHVQCRLLQFLIVVLRWHKCIYRKHLKLPMNTYMSCLICTFQEVNKQFIHIASATSFYVGCRLFLSITKAR